MSKKYCAFGCMVVQCASTSPILKIQERYPHIPAGFGDKETLRRSGHRYVPQINDNLCLQGNKNKS